MKPWTLVLRDVEGFDSLTWQLAIVWLHLLSCVINLIYGYTLLIVIVVIVVIVIIVIVASVVCIVVITVMLFLLLLLLLLLWFLWQFLSTFHPLHGSIEDSMARMNAEHFGKHVASWCMKNGHIFQQTYCIQWDCPWYTHFQGFAAFLADRLMCHTNPYKDIDGIFADAAADPWPLDSHG